MDVFQCTVCSVIQACISKMWMLSLKLLKCASALNSEYAKIAPPCTSDLLNMFTPDHWEYNISIDHAFSAFYCFKIVEPVQAGRIRLFQFTLWYLQQTHYQQNVLSNWNQFCLCKTIQIKGVSESVSGNTFYSQCDHKLNLFLCELLKKYPPNTRDKWNCKYLEPALTREM